MATVDEEDFIVIADRMSDVIRSGSEMVPTVLLENLAGLADFVLEATVVGVPDEVWGEIPMALVKLVPGSNATEEDFIKFLEVEGVAKGKITKWMLPKLVVIVDDVPKTSVGKYNKREIKTNVKTQSVPNPYIFRFFHLGVVLYSRDDRIRPLWFPCFEIYIRPRKSR